MKETGPSNSESSAPDVISPPVKRPAPVSASLKNIDKPPLWRGCVDNYTNGIVSGWAFGAGNLAAAVDLEVRLFGETIGYTSTRNRRSDLSRILGSDIQAGFQFDLTSMAGSVAVKLQSRLKEAAASQVAACDVLEVRIASVQAPLPVTEKFRQLQFDSESLLQSKTLDYHFSYLAQNAGNLVDLISHLGRSNADINSNTLTSLIIPMFSARWYRQQNSLKDTVTDIECLLRYLVSDFGNGRAPGPFFDSPYYSRQAVREGLEPPVDPENSYLHWIRFGAKKGICPIPSFDPETYVKLNPDLSSYPESPFLHFIRHGHHEGRQFNPVVRVAKPSPVIHGAENLRTLFDVMVDEPAVHEELDAGLTFWRSTDMAEICERAMAIEPEIKPVEEGALSMITPWQDADYNLYTTVSALIEGTYDNVVLMPFCKLGGADFVASVLASGLAELGKTIVLRTDQSDWARPDWFGPEITSVDLSPALAYADPRLKQRILYETLRSLRPKNVFNVNSRLAFETFETYGARLQTITNLHAYYFCADRTPDGYEAGYPVSFFANILPYLSSAMIDTEKLATTLAERYCLTGEMRKKLTVMYTPAMLEESQDQLASHQVAGLGDRKKPLLIWAGRFDRQKRFDLFVNIARSMPDVSFECWGAAVLDPMPSVNNMPDNLVIHPPFKSYEELPLEDCDGLVYTSAWDGLPTILIEFGARGMPIVASAVGGVPELIDQSTGWPVSEDAELIDYISAIRNMLSDPEERIKRAGALVERVQNSHSREVYIKELRKLVEGRQNNVQ